VLLREADDEYRVLSAFESLRLRTEHGAHDLLTRVLPLLRDGVNEDQLRGAVNPAEMEDLDILLAELVRRGLVAQVALDVAIAVDADGPIAAQVRFLANFLPLSDGPPESGRMAQPSGIEVQARLSEATVVLIGAGQLAARTSAQLARAGVGALTTFHAGNDLDSGCIDQLASALDGIDLAVVCPDLHQVSLLRAVNKLCLELGRTWTSARTLGSRVEVGPTIVPGDTACFGCYEHRRESNDPGYPEDAERAERLALEGLTTGRLAVEAADGILAAEVLKLASGFSRPMTYGALFSLDLVTLESGLHPVLKIPRCATCGAPARNRPTTSVWPFTP
jgi:bacteriocin biosynthesis cyclodehydratase domain-containing protein